MEIQLKKNNKRLPIIGAAVSALLATSYAAYALVSSSVPQVQMEQVEQAQVQIGDVDLYAEAYGELVSRQERLLTAPAQGKVAEVVLRPGAKVTPDSIILRLTNPKLEQELNEAKGELAKQEAEKAKFSYEQQSARLDHQSKIADVEAALAKAELELKVNQELMARGVAASLEVQRAQLDVQLQTKRLKFEQDKYSQLLDIQGFQLAQNDILIDQQASQVALLQQQLDDMHIRAGIQGSLQTLEVSLGESVQLGHSLAKVGSDNDLLARLRIPQRQADGIKTGAQVMIDTQKGKIPAHISRIETLVNDGVVIAEASLDGKLTSNARPALPISARVFMRTQKQANYITQLRGLTPNRKQSVYVMNPDMTAELRDVTFGELSQGKLLVLGGVSHSDTLVSPYQELANAPQIQLITTNN